jgi:hypothetical protein
MIELTTNAPVKWPRVRMEGLVSSDAAEAQLANRLSFTTALEATFRRAGIEVLEADVLRITKEGVLSIPLRIRAEDGEYDIFFYPVSDEDSAAHYMAINEIAQRWGRLRPVFYSTGDLLSIYPDFIKSVTSRNRLFIQAALAPPKGQYAMWWAKTQGEQFYYNPTYDLYDRIYREINGIESTAFALVLREIGLIEAEHEFSTETVSDATIEIPLEGPEGMPIIVSYSQYRGVRFHFHTTRTNPEYRDLFLNLFLMRVRHYKQHLTLEQTKRLDSPAYTWWRELGKRLRDSDSEQLVSAVGAVKR